MLNPKYGFAVKYALEGLSGHMVAIKRLSSSPYKIAYSPVDINKIANVERVVPSSMMHDEHKMDASFKDYCLPLIQGEISVKFKDGIVESAHLKKILAK